MGEQRRRWGSLDSRHLFQACQDCQAEGGVVQSSEVQSKSINLGQILQRHNPVEANKQVSLDTSSGWSQTAGLPAKVKKV